MKLSLPSIFLGPCPQPATKTPPVPSLTVLVQVGSRTEKPIWYAAFRCSDPHCHYDYAHRSSSGRAPSKLTRMKPPGLCRACRSMGFLEASRIAVSFSPLLHPGCLAPLPLSLL